VYGKASRVPRSLRKVSVKTQLGRHSGGKFHKPERNEYNAFPGDAISFISPPRGPAISSRSPISVHCHPRAFAKVESDTYQRTDRPAGARRKVAGFASASSASAFALQIRACFADTTRSRHRRPRGSSSTLDGRIISQGGLTSAAINSLPHRAAMRGRSGKL